MCVMQKVVPRGSRRSRATASHSSTKSAMCISVCVAMELASMPSRSQASGLAPMMQSVLLRMTCESGVCSSRRSAMKEGGPLSAGVSRMHMSMGSSIMLLLTPKTT